MKSNLLGWLMGGALVASLGWNATGFARPRVAADGTNGSCTAAAERLGDLGLAGARRDQLRAALARCDAESARLDARARELAAALNRQLRDPTAEAGAIRSAAKELAAVRASAVEECVDAALELRALLGPELSKKVLDACCEEGCGSCANGCGGE